MAIDPIMLGLMKKASSGTSGVNLNGYVSCSPQTFSEAQKTQARENIGAASKTSADPTVIEGYSDTSKQWLSQNNGTLKWITSTNLPDGTDIPMEDEDIDSLFGGGTPSGGGNTTAGDDVPLEGEDIDGVFGE